jgi:DNA polymerase III sliding clamp (beta) subunit (PCNA family)
LSFGTPASMSFNIDTLSVAAYPIFNNIQNAHFFMIKMNKIIKIINYPTKTISKNVLNHYHNIVL